MSSAISFIIPILNGEKYVTSCLNSITCQMEPLDEIIIIDNGSTDKTLELVKVFNITELLISDKSTIAALRNLGAAQANGNVFAFIDIDCIICNNWRHAVEKVLCDSSIAATGSLYDLPENPSWIEKAWWSSKPAKAEKARYMVGGNFIIRKEIFQELHGFDPTLITDEDSDFGVRLNKQGYTIIDDPQISAVHLGNPKDIREFIKKEKWHSASIIATMRKHGIDKPMLMTIAFMIFGLLSLLILFYSIWYDARALLLVPLFLSVPFGTTVYRVVQYGHYRFFLPLLVLYFFFYAVRSVTILESLIISSFRQGKN